MAVASKMGALTNLVDLAKRKRAPQNARPNPIKARIVEELMTEAKSISAPMINRAIPILLEGIFLDFSSSYFNCSFSFCNVSRVLTEGTIEISTVLSEEGGIEMRRRLLDWNSREITTIIKIE